MIRITPKAVTELRALLAEKQAPAGTGLRLSVERGGCAGLSYSISLAQPAEGDGVVEKDGLLFIVAKDSSGFLGGSEVDYEDSLNDSGFKIHNPNAVRSCGCGTSFELADKGSPVPATVPLSETSVCLTQG